MPLVCVTRASVDTDLGKSEICLHLVAKTKQAYSPSVYTPTTNTAHDMHRLRAGFNPLMTYTAII